MNVLYPRLLETANRLIASYGKPAPLKIATNGGTPHAPTTTYSDAETIIVEMGHKTTLISQTLVEANDKVCLGQMGDGSLIPKMNDKIIIDGARYNLEAVMPLNPGGLTLLYEFLARK